VLQAVFFFFFLLGEEIEITFSYWDGSGHRKTVKVQNRLSDYLI